MAFVNERKKFKYEIMQFRSSDLNLVFWVGSPKPNRMFFAYQKKNIFQYNLISVIPSLIPMWYLPIKDFSWLFLYLYVSFPALLQCFAVWLHISYPGICLITFFFLFVVFVLLPWILPGAKLSCCGFLHFGSSRFQYPSMCLTVPFIFLHLGPGLDLWLNFNKLLGFIHCLKI